ncbi:MAG: hypothetical protein LBL98_00115 [Ruminococcus sp.]|jgi:hypothetical protein|nr:hypothetical protein [Ruminococcus sp.]
MAKKTGKTKFVIDRKLTIPIFILTAAAAVFLRTYQLMNNTNLETGVYIEKGLQYDYPVMAIAAGMVIILLLLIFGRSNDKLTGTVTFLNPMNLPVDKLNKNFKAGSAAATLIAAGAILFGIIMDIGLVAAGNARINEGIEDEYFHVPALDGLTAVDWILYVLMIFTVITLIFVAVNMFKGDGITKLNCFFLMSIPIIETVTIFKLFFETQEEARIINLYSERMYIIFAGIAMVFFMMNLIRVFGGMEEKNNRKMLLFWGYLAAIILITSVLPRFLCYVILPYNEIGTITMPAIADVGYALICIVVIRAFFADFAYREMAKMTYKEGRRDHWISKLAEEEGAMDEISIESAGVDEEEKKQIQKNNETNVDELF